MKPNWKKIELTAKQKKGVRDCNVSYDLLRNLWISKTTKED